MTFSLVARCADTGMFGVAISSSSPAVAARCAYTRAGIGAVASQNVTDPRLGPLVLDRLQSGMSTEAAVGDVLDQFAPYRQILAINASGQTAIHSGGNALGIWGDASGKDVVAAGNLLSSEAVPQGLVNAFVQSDGHFGDRLIAAMKAGLDLGGEAGPVHSAGLQICDNVSWPVVDLRCDWTEGCPIEEIAAAWQVYKPQMAAYVQRALNPGEAPSYGVPGDE